MKKSLLLLMGIFSSMLLFSQSQLHVFQDWERTTGSQHFFYKNVTKTDASGNVYIGGATENGAGNYDILVAKYNSSGIQQWVHQIDGAAHHQDFATALQLDNSGNVYITGAITNDTTTFFTDLIIVKYNSSGTEQWRNTYDGAGNNDCGTDILASAGGSLVTGSSYNSSGNLDFVSILFNSSGTQLWATPYDYMGMNDVPVQIQKTGSSIFVSGGVQSGTTSYDWATVKYNTSGVQQSVKIGSGGTTTIEEVHGMATDASGNIYLAGIVSTLTDGYDYDVIKLDSNLTIQWEQTYDGSHYNDIANGLVVNTSGDVYVTGYSRTATGQNDYLTLKYDSSGSLVWTQTYNDSLNGNDQANAIAMDNSGNIYITGSAQTVMNKLDYYTMKYDASGTVKWGITFDGDKHLDDQATNIAIDTVGAVVVTGESETAAGVYEYATVRYVEKNVITPTDYNSETAAESYYFYGNKGQLLNISGTDISSTIHWYTNNTAPAYYIGDNNFSFVFSKVDTIPSTVDTMQRIDVTFNGNPNSNAKTYPLEQDAKYISYFLGHIPDGITELHANKRLVTPNFYNNIDLEYSSNQNGMKYYFIVKPGASPTAIQLEFTGASSFNLDGTTNALTISSLIGSITFDRPTVYQLNSSNVVVPITGWTADWQTNGASNKYKFNNGTYDTTKALIIEVDQGNGTVTSSSSTDNLESSTFYGGSLGDGFYDVTTDNAGNAYTTGETSSANFPVTHGVLQDTLRLQSDVVVVKFNTTTLKNDWATYYGGTNMDIGNALKVDANQEVYVAGNSLSSDFPLTSSPAYGYGGSQDGFVFKLNSTGTVKQFATLYGGLGYEVFNDITLDHAGNLYAVGSTNNSFNTVPLYPQTGTTSYTDGEGIILKLTTSGAKEWATRFGGTYKCDIKGVAVDASNNVFLTGNTRDAGFVQTNSNFTHAFGGTGADVDAFITKLNGTNNNIAWSSFYGGDNAETGDRIAIDGNGNVAFVGGTTSSSSTFPHHNNPAGGNLYGGSVGLNPGDYFGDGFIAVFDNSGHHLFGTYYGSSNNEEIFGVAFDSQNRLYVTGYTASSTNGWLIPSSNLSGGYDVSSLTGPEDVFIACFDASYTQLWGTYFGGNYSETGYGIACYQNDKLYATGLTNSIGNPFTNHFPLYDIDPINHTNYFQEYLNTNNSGSNIYADGYLARFDLAPVRIGIDEAQLDDAGIIVYPNPGDGVFNISMNLKGNKNAIVINIYNVVGQLVHSETIKKPQGNSNKTIDLSYLSSGMYMLQVQIDNNIYSKKLIKN